MPQQCLWQAAEHARRSITSLETLKKAPFAQNSCNWDWDSYAGQDVAEHDKAQAETVHKLTDKRFADT